MTMNMKSPTFQFMQIFSIVLMVSIMIFKTSCQEQSETVTTADTVITDSEIEPQVIMKEIEDIFHFIPLPASVPEFGEPGSSSGSLKSNSHQWTSIQLEDH